MIRQYHHAHDGPATAELPATVLVQGLSLFSLLPLLRTFWRLGRLHVCFVNSSKFGIQASNVLYKVGILNSPACPITREKLIPVDSHRNREDVMRTAVHLELVQLNHTLNDLVRDAMPKVDQFYSNLLAANIIKSFSQDIFEQERLVAYARRIRAELDRNATIILSSSLIRGYAARRRQGNEWQDGTTLINQFALSNTLLYKATHVYSRLLAISLWPSSLRAGRVDGRKAVGAAACWGTDTSKANDFFWWQSADIPASRLKYVFDRNDVQPTVQAVSEAHRQGIASVCLTRRARGEVHEVYYRKRVPVRQAVGTAVIALRLLLRAILADEWTRGALGLLVTEIVATAQLERQFKALDLSALWHYQEGGTDRVTAAIHLAGGMRFGTHWSCFKSVEVCHQRTPHVFFLWGPHDAKICLDAKSTSQHLLLAGCAITEMTSNATHRELAQTTSVSLRERGAKYILALFDGSTPSPNFYRFFLEWLIDDPSLGLLIKPKKSKWRAAYDGLDGLFERAQATGRVHAFDRSMWPADVALATDFAIGLSQLSATVVSALAGARVINLDYARLGQHVLTKPYATLHTLGENRCVFYDHETLKKAVLDYVRDPSSNPHLGDATPVLDQFDPFRDGKACQRIGEYVQWYLEDLDRGASRDDALQNATGNYADKWGEDRVVRGL